MMERAGSGEMQIRAECAFSEVHWQLVASILATHFALPGEKAGDLILSFARRFKWPFNLSWFRQRALDGNDRKVVAALCEALGADTVTLYSEYHLHSALYFRQQMTFALPGRGRGSEQSCQAVPEAQIVLGRLTCHIRSLVSVLLVQLAAFVLAVAFYVLAAACFLYGSAVLLLFLVEPAHVVVTATRQPSMGLALICTLVGLAAICGRAFRNVVGLLWRKLRR